ncbi:sulfurtransferase TusA family protein [Colwellia demingiae]|uniref:Sulfurtransferase TusA family protein n=1 Tax=Colwellia demingiae TaxID=89401 RepID=A0A5C6QGW7_9GAMM|nr:sulfurtransferase TusA family protein [Colwellia demingiae]TWX67802.1 sulfurtransferase TusA family protein [Colwellia demingiae]
MIYKYDGRGEKCPVPLVKLRLLLKKMQDDDQCIITIDDTGSINDIPKLLAKQGYFYQKQTTEIGIVEISISRKSHTSKN